MREKAGSAGEIREGRIGISVLSEARKKKQKHFDGPLPSRAPFFLAPITSKRLLLYLVMRIQRFKVMFTLNGKRVSDSRRQFLKIENEQINTVQINSYG